MEERRIELTAVYMKVKHGYVGFIQELPAMNSHGKTLDDVRAQLYKLALVVFSEERRNAREMLAGKEVVREAFSF
jgi:predicted RNase H-like HicB family nuclease